jgi:hypothetical protein
MSQKVEIILAELRIRFDGLPGDRPVKLVSRKR